MANNGKYKVHQYASLSEAIHTLTDGFVPVFAIDMDAFEKIIEIRYRTYAELHNLAESHNLIFIGIEKYEDFKF